MRVMNAETARLPPAAIIMGRFLKPQEKHRQACKLEILSLAVEIAAHAIEQRCLFFVLTNVDYAPEEDAVGCLVDGIGELAFEADRSVGQDRDAREALSPFAQRKSILHRRLPAEGVRDVLMTRHQRVDAEMARVFKSMKTRARSIDTYEKCWRRIADTADC